MGLAGRAGALGAKGGNFVDASVAVGPEDLDGIFQPLHRAGDHPRPFSASYPFIPISSVVFQSMHLSVTETPYLSWLKSWGMGWLPSSRLLSTIMPTIERLP